MYMYTGEQFKAERDLVICNIQGPVLAYAPVCRILSPPLLDPSLRPHLF